MSPGLAVREIGPPASVTASEADTVAETGAVTGPGANESDSAGSRHRLEMPCAWWVLSSRARALEHALHQIFPSPWTQVRITRHQEKNAMAKSVRDIMTADPACCSPSTTVEEVAKMMIQNDCGEIPIIDTDDRIVGVVTDRDIVCRVVAEGKNPLGYTVESCMSQPVITIRADAFLEEAISTMERHQIRRLPVVDANGHCAGIISQADIARTGPEEEVGELVREVSRDTGRASHARI
jgi:CBS domain-containing protein